MALKVDSAYRRVVNCQTCTDSGVIWLAPRDPAGGFSAESLRVRLQDGRVCMCTCAKAQWWVTWLDELAEPLIDRAGRPFGGKYRIERGVPVNLRRGGLDAA